MGLNASRSTFSFIQKYTNAKTENEKQKVKQEFEQEREQMALFKQTEEPKSKTTITMLPNQQVKVTTQTPEGELINEGIKNLDDVSSTFRIFF